MSKSQLPFAVSNYYRPPTRPAPPARLQRELQTQAQALREAELEGVQLQLNKLALNVVLVNESNVVYGDW